MLDVTVDLNLKPLEAFADELERELEDALNATLFFMQGVAVSHAPIDTGFLRASMFVVTKNQDGGVSALARAKGFNPDAGFLMDYPRPIAKFEGYLVVGAEYGYIVNYGAFHRRGNTQRVGNRAGRIGVRLDDGGIATYTPGYLFMEEAMEAGRAVLLKLSKSAVRTAKLKAGL